jgi:exodeoxyribonuclease III
VKLATWNINSIRVRLPQVLDWLKRENPDVLCLQETKVIDTEFPTEEFRQAGYHSVYTGQKTYNGVATFSRQSPVAVITNLPGIEDPQRRFIAATVGKLRVANVYVPNGEAVGSEKYAYKLSWLKALHKYVVAELKTHTRLVVVGDFNVAPEEHDVHDPKAWEGRVLFSDKERNAFARLIQTGMVDVFRQFEQPEKSFSWWDYRQGAFRRNQGLRIDHILCSSVLATTCTACGIDKAPRGLERPSDHAPVVAVFNNI